MKGKGSEEGVKTVISFSLTDPEVNVCQGLQLPGNRLQMLHINPTQTTLNLQTTTYQKKRNVPN